VAHQVVMPQMGESIAEGTVTTWLKKVGEHVERDEPLFEISTDKVDAEIPSPVAGTLLEIKVQPGDTVPIDTIVAVIGEAGEVPEASAPSAPKPAAAAAPAAVKQANQAAAPAAPQADGAAKSPPRAPAGNASAPSNVAGAARASGHAPADTALPTPQGSDSPDPARRTKSSPVVRKIAAEHGVDVQQLQGSGLSGRVTKQDILTHLQTPAAPAAKEPHGQASSGHLGRGAQAGAPAKVSGSFAAGSGDLPEAYRAKAYDGDKVEELSTMRAKIAEHMVMSKRISSHVATVWEMDFSHIARLRAKHKAAWEERFGVNLTYTAFIMKAAVDALKAFPMLNASLDGTKVVYHRDINLGLAVALDWGLIVPVVHKADELNLLGLARRAVDLAGRARTKKLKPDEVQSGTFTITNPGNFGAMFNIPVINQPQVAILGVGTVEKRPVIVDDAIAIRTRGYLSLSFDHRLVDGAVADQFMLRVKKGLEGFDPGEL
jgi:pyruvate dehydrogenase E2 component (dihydrolipoamide acetyltransferase)